MIPETQQLIDNITWWQEHYFDFCKDCLGYRDMNDEHRDLCNLLQSGRRKFRLVLLPRYTFKSSVVTMGFALWKLIRDPNYRILIYSDSASKAQNFLTGIKNHILGSSAGSVFSEYFQHWEMDPHKGKWNESQIVITPRWKGHTEPTIDTGGIETSKVGMHYDLIFFDDIVSDINTTTKEQMDKVYECYQKSLSLLKPGGEVVVTGTRWHFGDTYGRLLEDNRKSNAFDVMIRDAEEIKNGKLIFENVGLNREFLDEQRKRQGSYIFSCLYRNSPVDDETATFKVADFKFYGTLQESPRPQETGLYSDLFITGAIDPAGQGEDFTGITVVGTDRNLRMYVLDIVNKHLQTNEMVDEIIRLNQIYHFRRFGVETVFFRGRLKKDLELRIEKERSNVGFHVFGVEELQTRWRKGEGKHQRIEALQPFHERGDLLFPGDTFEGLDKSWRDLAFQMIQYPSAPHDDILDSLSWHVQLIQRGGVPKKGGPPKNTMAWLEQKWVEKYEERMSRYPTKYRKKIQLAFS